MPPRNAVLAMAAATIVTMIAVGAPAAHAANVVSQQGWQRLCHDGGHAIGDPIALYGPVARYEVQRNGEPVGRHVVRFDERGDELVVESRFDLAIRRLGLVLYRFRYVSTEVWRDGCLVSLRAEIDDDGRPAVIEAVRNGDRLTVSGPAGRLSAEAGMIPTNHWYVGALSSRQVLNTLTGGIDNVAIVDRGQTMRRVNGSLRAARHYAYTGDLATEVWYDADGRWLGMSFAGKDGSTIDVVCERCVGEVSARR